VIEVWLLGLARGCQSAIGKRLISGTTDDPTDDSR